MADESVEEPNPPGRLADDEPIGMWFVPHPGYFTPPDSPGSSKFDLRPATGDRSAEKTLSVWRMSRTTEKELRRTHGLADDIPFVVRTVGQVRALTAGDDAPLDLDVVSDPEHGGPAHAGILDPNGRPGRSRKSVSKALKRLFCEPWPP